MKYEIINIHSTQTAGKTNRAQKPHQSKVRLHKVTQFWQGVVSQEYNIFQSNIV